MCVCVLVHVHQCACACKTITYHSLLQQQAEENGVADLSEDLEYFSSELTILDHRRELGIVEAKNTWEGGGRRGKRGGEGRGEEGEGERCSEEKAIRQQGIMDEHCGGATGCTSPAQT